MTQHRLGWTECAEGLRMSRTMKLTELGDRRPIDRKNRELADTKHSRDDGYSKQSGGYAPL